MSGGATVVTGGPIFDGRHVHQDAAAVFAGGGPARIVAAADAPPAAHRVDLGGRILSPGFTDLQVNGGGGILLGDDPSVAGLARIAAAHREQGTTALLPTLITDTPDVTRAAIDAVAQALRELVPGIAGLHLEGPHLDSRRAGAHDPARIRPMTDSDLAMLCDAARRVPALMVTLAPEAATPAQVAALARAGAVVSLGHTDTGFETALRYAEAGARCVTHLFNAMSGLSSRAPGLVGAALHAPGLAAGLIADGVHVHPATLRAAWAAKRGRDRLFLVTDAMAVAGTQATSFTLGGRTVFRHEGHLTLEDGTLAGADLTMARAVSVLTGEVGVPLVAALRAATVTPARLIGRKTVLTKDTAIRIDLSGGTAAPLFD